ncbi:MAG: hypothetical protein Q7S22_08965 [Candidatus Micrarchaeota archaeon]|nr:hypothetical protein [Candidatus Micrarchaeota archaeon]
MISKQLEQGIARDIRRRANEKLIGRRLPYNGQQLQTVRQFRHLGEVYLVKIETNDPLGSRKLDVFGPIEKGADWSNASSEAENHWSRVTGATWFGIARIIMQDKLDIRKLQHSEGILLSPEQCEEICFDVASVLKRKIVDTSRLSALPHVADVLEAKERIAVMQGTKEGRYALKILAGLENLVRTIADLESTLKVELDN